MNKPLNVEEKDNKNMTIKQTQILMLEENFKMRGRKINALEKKISRTNVDNFKLESEIRSPIGRTKEGQ